MTKVEKTESFFKFFQNPIMYEADDDEDDEEASVLPPCGEYILLLSIGVQTPPPSACDPIVKTLPNDYGGL